MPQLCVELVCALHALPVTLPGPRGEGEQRQADADRDEHGGFPARGRSDHRRRCGTSVAVVTEARAVGPVPIGVFGFDAACAVTQDHPWRVAH
jgi:hypothetical protein